MGYRMAFVLGGRLHAVNSRNQTSAENFAKSFGLPKFYTSRPQFLVDQDVKKVYLATPNHTHKDLCLEALDAGKHVLCEKPLAATVAEVDEIEKAAKAANRVVMEGMWSRFLPIYQQIAELLEDGAIGEPQRWEAKLGHQVPRSEDGRFYSQEGGGALLDLGVYPLAIGRFLFGEQRHVATQAAALKGVDEETTLRVTNDFGVTGRIDVSFRHQLPETMTIYGEWGRIDISGPVYRPESFRVVQYQAISAIFDPGKKLSMKQKLQWSPALHGVKRYLKNFRQRVMETDEIRVGYKGDGYIHQILAFEQAVKDGAGQVEQWPLSCTRNVVEVLEASRATFRKS